MKNILRIEGAELSTMAGPIVDQSTLFPDLKNASYQDNADKAIHSYIH